MKPTVNERLDAILGLPPATETNSLVTQGITSVVSSGDPEEDLRTDLALTRSSLTDLVKSSSALAASATFHALEKQSDAKVIEAAAIANREARDIALALLGIHKTRREIDRVSGSNSKGDTNITQNAVFVGTTGELLRFTKEMNSGLIDTALKALDTTPSQVTINTIAESED